MRALCLVVVAVATLITLGCGSGTRGAEKAAEEMLEAWKDAIDRANGTWEPQDEEVERFLSRIDLSGLYDSLTDEERDGLDYHTWKETLKRAMERPAVPGIQWNIPFGYEVAGSRRGHGGMVYVKVRTLLEHGDLHNEQWEEAELGFKKVGGKWKVAAEEWKRAYLSFRRGPRWKQ